MSGAHPGSDEPEERPGWLYPLILASITVVIGAVILLVMLVDLNSLAGPAAAPTTDAELVRVTIGGRTLAVPSNYMVRTSDRDGGAKESVELVALLPDLHGFGSADRDAIKDVSRTSPVVTITLMAGAPELDERTRLERIYRRSADPGVASYDQAGLTVIPLADTSGYAGQDALSGEIDGATVVFLCTRDDPEHELGGLCQRETAFGADSTLVYAFRSGRLPEWKDLTAKVGALLAGFEAAAK